MSQMPRRRNEQLRKFERQIEGVKNPTTGRTERWRQEAINTQWNVYLNPALYREFEKEFRKEYPTEQNALKRHIKKNVNILKRETLVGPFLQSHWQEWDSKYGGMEHRPQYLLDMITEHLKWKNNFTDIELTKVKIISIKPMSEDMDNPYPSQLRITFANAEQANLCLMRHSFSEGQFPKKANKCKIMMLDEFMTRYHELASYIAIKKQAYHRDHPGHKMYSLITYSGDSLEIWTFLTARKNKGWELFDTTATCKTPTWFDDYQIKPGSRLEPYQMRLAKKKRAPQPDLGEMVGGTWIMPVLQNKTGDIRNRSQVTINSSDDEDIQDNKAAKLDSTRLSGNNQPEILRDDDIIDDNSTIQICDLISEAGPGHEDTGPSENKTFENTIQTEILCDDTVNSDNCNDFCDSLCVDPSMNKTGAELSPPANDATASDAPLEAGFNRESIVIVNDSKSHKLTIDIRVPQNIVMNLLLVALSLLSAGDSFYVEDYLLTIEEKKAQDGTGTLRVAETDINTGKRVGKDVFIEGSGDKISIWSRGKTTLGPENAVTKIWRTFIHKILKSMYKEVTDTAGAPAEDGDCIKCGGRTYFKCPICQGFIHNSSSCANKGACKVGCKYDEKVDFLADDKLLRARVQSALLKCAKKRSREESQECTLKNVQRAAMTQPMRSEERAPPPGTITFPVQSLSQGADNALRRQELSNITNGRATTAGALASIMTGHEVTPLDIARDLVNDLVTAATEPENYARQVIEFEDNKKQHDGTMDLMSLLEITEEDLINEVRDIDVTDEFQKHFPIEWIRWVPLRTDRRLRNIFFLEPTLLNGDCFWDSICKILIMEKDFSLPSDPIRLREKVVNQLFGSETLDEWVRVRHGGGKTKKAAIVKKFSKSGIYTDEDGYIVAGTAEVLNREIRIVSPEYMAPNDPRWYKSFKFENKEPTNKQPIWLAYSQPAKHFRALFLKNRYKGLTLKPATESDRAATKSTVSQDASTKQHQKSKGKRPKMTPEEMDEQRRRRELTKSDLQIKLDAAELHCINLQRSLGQSEEKIKLLEERVDRYESYTHFLESEMSRLRLDPNYKVKDLAFTASDHVNMVRIRDTLSDLVTKMGEMTEDISTLKNRDRHCTNDNHSVSDSVTGIPGQEERPAAPGMERLSQETLEAQASPSRISFKEKVRKFSTLGDPQKSPNL